MKKALIIDDDPLICDLLQHFCSKQGWISSCQVAIDGSQGLHALRVASYDFIFLDFNLPDLNGQQILELIPNDIPVIMVTTEEQFAVASYEYDQVVDFLKKPISYERFLKAMLRIQQLNQQSDPTPAASQEKIVVKDGTTKKLISISDIRYLKSEANYVTFYLKDSKVMGLTTMKKVLELLPNSFIQVHRSFVIQLNAVEAIEKDHVLIDGQEIPIGATHKAVFDQRISNWYNL